MKIALRDVARALGASPQPAVPITGWSVDSRTLAAGDLFFALRGPRHDGNAHIPAAFEKGAVGAVGQRAGKRIVTVPDTQQALERLASWARTDWNGDVAGITGSAGKTSTKDVIAEILAAELPVGKTSGNFNNHVGVPLSILRLPDEARVAVLEIGMNHAGEIRHLCEIARPRIGIVTNVGYAHIEMFDSIEEIALAKRELIESLPRDGIAVLNNDDPFVREFGAVHGGPVLRFGLSEGADVRAQQVEFREEGTRFRVCETAFQTSLQGRHAVLNVLAGICAAQLYGISPAQACRCHRSTAAGQDARRALHAQRDYCSERLL